MKEFTCCPVGDQGVLIQFKREISEETNDKVLAFADSLKKEKIKGVIEWVPSFHTLMVYYNPLEISYDELTSRMKQLDLSVKGKREEKKIHHIPVLYGGEVGPDLPFVAKYNGLTEEEVIHLHSNTVYRIYMVGFVPGFPYLGGLNPLIHTPRLNTPRLKVPGGSVGIAGEQTGIYPMTTPGGWRIIGHSPLPLFQIENEQQPTRLQAGEYVKFIPITKEEYHDMKQNKVVTIS